jgi:hypothetical protein
LKPVNLKTLDVFISFDVRLFTDVPANEALQVIRNKLHNNNTLVGLSLLQVKAILGLLKVSLRTTDFQVDHKFFQQRDGMTMGSSLSPIISNIYMEHFEKLALDSAQHKPLLRLWYVDDTFVVCPHGPEQLQNFLSNVSCSRPSIQLIIETEAVSVILFLAVMVIKKKMTLATKVCRRPTHTGRYLNFKSNHPLHVKRGLIQSLHNEMK